MTEGEIFTFLDWVRIIEVPLWFAVGAALIKHAVSDTKAQTKLQGDVALHDAEIRALRSEIELKAAKSAEAVAASIKEILRAEMATADRRTEGDFNALTRQLAAVQLEIATHYMKRSDVQDHMSGVESRMTAAIADLKNDFRERLDALFRLLNPASKV